MDKVLIGVLELKVMDALTTFLQVCSEVEKEGVRISIVNIPDIYSAIVIPENLKEAKIYIEQTDRSRLLELHRCP